RKSCLDSFSLTLSRISRVSGWRSAASCVPSLRTTKAGRLAIVEEITPPEIAARLLAARGLIGTSAPALHADAHCWRSSHGTCGRTCRVASSGPCFAVTQRGERATPLRAVVSANGAHPLNVYLLLVLVFHSLCICIIYVLSKDAGP